ncbi:hypothetical protein ACFE04_030278 [Oxalis oulophora]
MSNRDSLQWMILLLSFTIITFLRVNSVVTTTGVCELSFIERNKLYNYTLASPISNFPHGILSEDGFYKVAVNETVIWFQLCDGMIFNHDPPQCVGCMDCGGPLRCGMECSALVANNDGGYQVCTTLGYLSYTGVNVLDLRLIILSSMNIVDKQNPHKGVTIKMSNNSPKDNCSLSVSVFCNPNVREPQTLEQLGKCDYATELWHPSGCATIISVHGRGWGWFGTFIIIILCAFGGYLLMGTVYRLFYLGIRGIDAIPNLEFWVSVPHRTQRLYGSLVQKIRGPTNAHHDNYSRVNF